MFPQKKNDNFGEFYKDLDKKKFNSFCSLPLVIITLIIIFLLVVFGLWTLKKQIFTDRNLDNNLSSSYQIEDKNIADFISQKIVDKEVGEKVVISIYEEELAELIEIDNVNFPLKNATLNIEERGVIIKGKTSDSILSFSVEVLFEPYINDQKQMALKVMKANAGFVNLPNSLKEKLNQYIDNSINKEIEKIDNLEFDSVKCYQDYLELTGTIKE